jgi:surfeit locus 1 family protein
MLKSMKTMFSRTWLLTTCLVFLGILLTIRLGFWQLDRLNQENVYNSHLLVVQEMPELDLSVNLNGMKLTDMEYRSVNVTGTFDFSRQVVIRNQVWVQPWGNEIGYTLLTPLKLQDGKSVLVQRGWIPLSFDTPSSWHNFDQPGEVTIEGIIRLPLEKGEMGGGIPDPTLSPGQEGLYFWNYVNIERIQQQLPYELYPIYIQQKRVSEEEKLPYLSNPNIELINGSHLGYALQWFFYAILLIIGYPIFIRRQ